MPEVVVVHMHRKGLLDDKNQPTAAAQSATKLACPAFTMKPSVNVKRASAAQPISLGC